MKAQLIKFFSLVTVLLFWNVAQSQELPRPSQAHKVTQRVGLTDITIDYSRPNAKGREIFGDLVPYNKVWRTGANAATIIETSSYISIQGQGLAPGKYAIFTKPQDDGVWEIMINTKWDQWGSKDYKPEFDMVSVSAPVRTMNDYTETFTIGFDNVLGDEAIMFLQWANTRVEISIVADSKKEASKNINDKIKELNNTHGSYNTIAGYFLREGNAVEALKYAEQSVSLKATFWNIKTLSEAYAANGNYAKAIESAQKSLALSQEAGNESYVKQNEVNLKKWKAMK
jgi:hypothetical protein